MAIPDVIPSELSTLVDDVNNTNLLNSISPYFKVSETKYGGNGCFSYEDIPPGTTIHTAKLPLGSTIAREFRKEVCSYCFYYDHGNNMKYKLTLPGFNLYIFFCSEACGDKFRHYDDEHQNLIRSLLIVEQYYVAGLKKGPVEYEDPETDNLIQLSYDEWEKVALWDVDINKLKPSKWVNLIPAISDTEYLEIKYIITVLFQMYRNKNSSIPCDFLVNIPSTLSQLNFETKLFEYLQSNEILKVLKYPYLLYSYINIYKFIKLSSLPCLQEFINPLSIRLIIGNNLTNAFGIWSQETDEQVDKEFLGFGVYPSASFFNHSCQPNMIKKRINNELHFITKLQVQKGDELCIDYGNYLNEDVTIRQQYLKEWFFDCGCKRCTEELCLNN